MPSSAGLWFAVSFFSLLLSRFFADGVRDFLSFGDLGDLDRPDLDLLDRGLSPDLALPPASSAGGVWEVSLSAFGVSGRSTGSCNGIWIRDF